MNNLSIFKLEDIEVNNIKFSRPIKIKKDIVVPILYSTQPFLVQVPSLYLNNSYNGNNVIILPLIGRTEQTTIDVVNFFSELDRTIISNIKNILYGIKRENRYMMDFSNISYKSIINEIEGDDNEVYKNGLIKYKINGLGDFSSKIYDEGKNYIAVNEYENKLIKGIYIKSIIEINSLVLRDNVIHVYIKPHQLRITEERFQSINLESYSFIDSDDEDNSNEIILNTQTDYLEMDDVEDIKKCNDVIDISDVAPNNNTNMFNVNMFNVNDNNNNYGNNISYENLCCNESEMDNYRDNVSESSDGEEDGVFNLNSE